MSEEPLKIAADYKEKLDSNWTETEKRINWMNKAKRNSLARPFLNQYYKKSNLYESKHFGNIYPFVAPKKWNEPINPIDDVLGNFQKKMAKSYCKKGIKEMVNQKFHRECDSPEDVKNTPLQDILWNSKIYNFIPSKEPPFDFTLTDYFSFSSRYTLYRTKLYNRFYSLNSIPPTKRNEVNYSSITASDLRKNTLPSIIPAIDSKTIPTKPTGVGMTTLTIFDTGDKLLTPIAQRSPNLSRNPGRISPLPSGYFEIIDSPSDDFSLEELVLREFIEELYDIPENINDYSEHQPYPLIQKLLQSDNAQVWHTGGGISLIDGSVNLTSLLYIQSSDFLENNPIRTNWESSNYTLYDLNQNQSISEALGVKYTTGESALSVDAGLKTLEKQMNINI